jgi:hypothetical protein
MPGKIEWRKGPVCGIDRCKSTQYREEDGLTWCRRGHQQEVVIYKTPCFYGHVLTALSGYPNTNR